MEEINFKKHTGETTPVKILTEKKIGEGKFGEIFDAVVEMGGHKKRFIIKRYKDTNPSRSNAKNNTKAAMYNYGAALKAGLTVFPTFRIGEDEKSILMTRGFSENEICLGANNTNLKKLGEQLIEEIENIDKFLKDFFADCIQAAEKGISLHLDSFFFILNKTEPRHLDFVVGDLDNVSNKESRIKKTAVDNIDHALESIYSFIEQNVEDYDKKRFFFKKIKSCYDTMITTVAKNTKLKTNDY